MRQCQPEKLEELKRIAVNEEWANFLIEGVASNLRLLLKTIEIGKEIVKTNHPAQKLISPNKPTFKIANGMFRSVALKEPNHAKVY
ncbi:hypothetical protein SAMN05661012_06066 [Chitinophaga sancti]|uniref:Uncharacterized protein n=1 Tax=Chitinophaga sancti TaxID=1004 RepID=A0A1K1SST5_9BACT|nr:hypothetical protein SAMN05661012_06066 [Chitinophaga sancti]